MLKFRATSTRVTDWHGSNCFANSQEDAEKWAKREILTGYDAAVYRVTETLVSEFLIPRCEYAGCRRVLESGAKWCSGCGRPVEVTGGK